MNTIVELIVAMEDSIHRSVVIDGMWFDAVAKEIGISESDVRLLFGNASSRILQRIKNDGSLDGVREIVRDVKRNAESCIRGFVRVGDTLPKRQSSGYPFQIALEAMSDAELREIANLVLDTGQAS